MSKYTTQVRFICENAAGLTESKGYNDVKDIIAAAIPKVFSFDFPIFDETYRTVLCTKILKHYYTREICEETVGLWKLRLDERLNLIMPYYNQLYKSALIEFDPLTDTKITTEHNGTNNVKGSNKGNSGSTSKDKQITKFSDTPQGSLINVESGEYLTNATIDESNGEGTNEYENTNAVDTVDKYINVVSGKTGAHTYSAMIQEFRKTFLNIDERVIKDLEDLFFGLW